MPFPPVAPGASSHGFAIVKSDTTIFSPPISRLWVGGVGNVAVIMANDTAPVTFTAVAAGTMLEIQCTQVMSTNTTATLMVGLY